MKRSTLEYDDGSVPLKGILLEGAGAGRRPGVIVFPDARGLDDHAIEFAGRLVGLGFAALVADLYGDGTRARDLAHARELMRRLRSDAGRWRARAEAARRALSEVTNVDPGRIAAVGFCFGGTTALDLALGGAPIAAVVSFHGGVSPRPERPGEVVAKVLVCHGAADTLVTLAELTSFEDAMARTAIDWQVCVYGGAAHGFTTREAGGAVVPEFAYNPAAARRSWAAMIGLFDEVFGESLSPRT